jgi:hypothetical protein
MKRFSAFRLTAVKRTLHPMISIRCSAGLYPFRETSGCRSGWSSASPRRGKRSPEMGQEAKKPGEYRAIEQYAIGKALLL